MWRSVEACGQSWEPLFLKKKTFFNIPTLYKVGRFRKVWDFDSCAKKKQLKMCIFSSTKKVCFPRSNYSSGVGQKNLL